MNGIKSIFSSPFSPPSRSPGLLSHVFITILISNSDDFSHMGFILAEAGILMGLYCPVVFKKSFSIKKEALSHIKNAINKYILLPGI